MQRVLLLSFLALVADTTCSWRDSREYCYNVAKGLDWLAKEQHKDGYWRDHISSIAMTAFAGMALLQEGSTDHSGKYQMNIRKAVAWLLSKSITNEKDREGLIGDPESPSETLCLGCRCRWRFYRRLVAKCRT